MKYVDYSPRKSSGVCDENRCRDLGRGHEIGTLEAGKLADVLIVDGDMLADISLLEKRNPLHRP
ncbi:MAG: hypothetical protein U0792_21340 [Gemmataceae bacterium]